LFLFDDRYGSPPLRRRDTAGRITGMSAWTARGRNIRFQRVR
jgi:hypothetical protein